MTERQLYCLQLALLNLIIVAAGIVLWLLGDPGNAFVLAGMLLFVDWCALRDRIVMRWKDDNETPRS